MEMDTKSNALALTRVGTGILISGRIEGDGNVVVEGRIDGEVRIKGDLQIEVSGQVRADVHARNIYVLGVLVGNAEAAEKVEIAEGGRMVGDVRSPRMLINEGAAFRGMVDMVDFEGEERPAESRKAPRRQNTPATSRASALRSTGAPTFASPPRRGATPRTTPPRDNGAQGGVYSTPPLPKPPEFVGSRKAIIIKKKPTSEGL